MLTCMMRCGHGHEGLVCQVRQDGPCQGSTFHWVCAAANLQMHAWWPRARCAHAVRGGKAHPAPAFMLPKFLLKEHRK